MAKKLTGEEFYLSANDLTTGDVIYLAKNKWSTDFNKAIKIKKNEIETKNLSDLILYTKIEKSKSEIKRLINNKGIKINNLKVDNDLPFSKINLSGKKHFKLSIGKKKHFKIEFN